MDDKPKNITYRIAKFFYKRLLGINKKINSAAREINFLMYKMEFGERDDDIYVISYPKSGTTLVQMILYQLTTDGEINFDHFDDVSPWIRNESFKNNKPKQLKSPRIIKSHDIYRKFDFFAKGRFIYVFRNVMDVAVSKYHQDKNYKDPKLDFNTFIEDFFKPGKYNWFTYHREWLRNKRKARILYLRYEDILNHFDQVLEKIIDFCEIDRNKIDYNRVKERTSFEFMKKHEDKFGVRPPQTQLVYDQFLRKGKIGDGKEHLTEEQMKEFKLNYEKYISPVLSQN